MTVKTDGSYAALIYTPAAGKSWGRCARAALMLPAAAALTRPASVSGPRPRVQVSSRAAAAGPRVAASAEEQTARPRLSTPGAVRLLTEQSADTSLAWTRDIMRHVSHVAGLDT